jgi:hypothetical protein
LKVFLKGFLTEAMGSTKKKERKTITKTRKDESTKEGDGGFSVFLPSHDSCLLYSFLPNTPILHSSIIPALPGAILSSGEGQEKANSIYVK